MKKIKIAQIGVAHEHAAGKILTLRKMPDVFDIVGVVDDRTSTSARFPLEIDMKPYEGLKFLTEEEVFAIPGLQAVVVETANADLVPTAIRCMEHNLAIHMDKPGGESLEPFVWLRKSCEDKNLPFQIGYVFRCNPAFQWCIKAIRQGWLGDILEVEGSMNHNYGGDAYQNYLGHFTGGIMYNLGGHLIDVIVAILGEPKRVVPFLKYAPGWPEYIKNNCLAILEYPYTTVTLRACSLDPDGLAHRRFRVVGTKGTAELCPLERFDGKPLQMRLTLLEGNKEYPAGTHIVNFGVIRDRYAAQLIELAQMINSEKKNPYSCEHDILVHKILLAAAGYIKWI